MDRVRLKWLVEVAAALLTLFFLLWAPKYEPGSGPSLALAGLGLVANVLGYEVVRRMSLGEALALGYFWNFIHPVAEAIRTSIYKLRVIIPDTLDSSDARGYAVSLARLHQFPTRNVVTPQRTYGLHHGGGGNHLLDVPTTLDTLLIRATSGRGKTDLTAELAAFDRKLRQLAKTYKCVEIDGIDDLV